MNSLTSVIFKNSRRRITIANTKESLLGILAFLIVFGFLGTSMAVFSISITKQLQELREYFALQKIQETKQDLKLAERQKQHSQKFFPYLE